MFGKKKQQITETNGFTYRRAKTWQIALASCSSGIGMSFYVLLGLASYVANAGYGIATAVVGLILTATRILDGVTDPIIAIIIDKMNTKFGKIRILTALGWAIESLAVLMMYCWASGKGHGIVLFVVLYCVYIIGYTLCNVTAQIVPAMLTNDPKQRPMVGVWSTAYNYLVPMILNIVITVMLLPQYGNVYSVEMLAAACKVCVAVSAAGLILCCIGVTDIDKPENFKGVSTTKKNEPVKFKDMVELVKSNRALQSFIVAASSDKIASQTASQAVVTTIWYYYRQYAAWNNPQCDRNAAVYRVCIYWCKICRKARKQRINGDMDLCMHDSDSYTCRIIYTDRSDADRDSSADDDRVCRTYFNLKWS